MCVSGNADASSEAELLAFAARLSGLDEVAPRREFAFDLPSWAKAPLIACLNDPRDEPCAVLAANLALTTLPCALAVLVFASSHWVGLAFLVANYIMYMQRYMLTLHVTEHRPLFRKEYGWMNAFLPWVVCVPFGVPCGLYRPHHVIMHHVEDNSSLWDLSSTEPYQRDSVLHFLAYWLRHAVLAWGELPLYCIRRKRYALAAQTAGGAALFWGTFYVLFHYVNPVGALWVFVIPFFFSSLPIMLGNWSQHVFVTPGGARDAFGMTYNCTWCPDNCLTYNDGYHILHHLNSRLHWSQMPAHFAKMMPELADKDALTFSGIGFFDVGAAVFSGNLGFLADRIVPLSRKQAARSRDEWCALLRQRLRPVDTAQRH